MIIGMVIGNVWATRKEESLNGLKWMIVQRLDLADGQKYESFAAADCVGSGVGEKVLVATGSAARKALRADDVPVDAAIVGILDEAKGSQEA